MPRIENRLYPSFASEVRIAEPLVSSEVFLEVAADRAETASEVARAAQAFEIAARTGMFSVEPAGRPPSIEVVSVDVDRPDRVRRVWRVDRVQVGAFRVLLNMLEVIHVCSGPLSFVRLVSMKGHGDTLSVDRLIATPFPMRGKELPFALTLKRNLEESEEPLVRMEFGNSVSDSQLEVMVPLLVAWDAIVIRGGFFNDADDRLPDTNVEESLEGQQTYLAAPNVVEHLFYEFIGAAAAYDALINVAVRIHHTVAPLTSFEIG
jgi:hypothetical protein